MEENQFVIFKLGDEEYGTDIMNVQEIILPPKITSLPGTPPHVLGIVNLRGAIVPIINLKQRLGLEDSEDTEETRVIIVKVENHSYGIIVDSVQEVLRLNSEQIDRGDDVYHGIDRSFIKGIARMEDRLVILLKLSTDI